jgi:polyisoprenoid-binding protein YceI
MKRVVLAGAGTLALAVAVSSAQAPAGGGAQQPGGKVAVPIQTQLAPDQWNIDASHSAATFSVRHMMVTTVRGSLGPITGLVSFDGKNVASIAADVKVDVNGISTQNAKRDAHLRSDDFFDVANHPTISFKSKRAEPVSDGRFRLVGDLTIRGTTKEVVLDVEGPTPAVKDQRGIRIGATATTRVKRLEYGLKYNSMVEAGPVVGDEVTITIDLELTRPTPAGASTP